MATNYITTGTASVTNGTTTITFASVSVSLFKQGDLFIQNTSSGVIASVDTGAGTATLVNAWGGVTSSTAAYLVMTIPVGAELATSTRTIMQYLSGPLLTIAALSGASFPADGNLLISASGDWLTVASTGTGDVVRAASPTFTGILTGPDASTWGSAGFNNASVLKYSIGGTEVVRINSTGILMGSTVAGGWRGNAAAAIQTSGTGGLSVYASGSLVNAIDVRLDDTGSSTCIQFWNNGTACGGINQDGTTGVTYDTTSDARLKNVLLEQDDYRAAIQALWVGDFEWKANGKKAFGVLAQQAYEHMPNHQGVSKPADDEGQWRASAEPYGHLALWGVKDLYALVDAIADRIALLEEGAS